MREMKDSGFGYLGNIPATWRTERVKNHLRFSPEKNPGRSIVLSLYREYGIVPKDSRDDNYNVTSEDTSNYRYVHVGDFVVNKMKAWQGSMGVSAYEGIVSPAYFVYRFTTLYRKNALCKYLLVAIENQGKEKVESSSLSIEHIMPQNKNLSKAWRDMLGENWEQIHDRYLHTLGNLTLTGYNSELGDRPFDEKKALLQDPETPTHITILYQGVLEQEIWDEEMIKGRAKKLADKILQLFPIEAAKTVVDFSDPRYREYKATNPDDATYKYVNYYELLGEKVTVDSFAVMVRSVAEKLYDMDSTVIENMAIREEPLPGWSTPIFSYDERAVKYAVELKKGTGIYINSGYSAHNCVWIIRELLKLHDLDIEEDFVYSARSYKKADKQEA